jgi:hypothetical protein
MNQSIQRIQTNTSLSPEAAKEDGGQKHPYDLKRIEIKNAEYRNETPEHLQNKDIPGFPSTVVLIGRPGSGKTNLLMNLLTRPEFYFGFFDKIYALGPTVKSDKLYQTIRIPDSQKVTDPADFIPKVVEWTEAQVDEVKNSPEQAPKCLFIFEDITSYRHTIQNNPNFVKCFTTIRHHKSTAIALVHKFAALERTCRMNCMHIIVFPVNQTDIRNLYNDYGTYGLNADDFKHICRYAWRPTPDCKKPFLYINMYAENPNERFRKCFTEIIPVEEFQGISRHYKQKDKQKWDSKMGTGPGKGLAGQKRKAPESEDSSGSTKSWKDQTISPSVLSNPGSSSEMGALGQKSMGAKKPPSVLDNVLAYVK